MNGPLRRSDGTNAFWVPAMNDQHSPRAIFSGGTAVLYAKKRYIGHPLFYSKFGPYSIQI